ncbi:hypothetical protein ABW19_dt0201898 [Dactylella cylindrospora]|nr:hypothetical protein ABW19_dt0201898 [Dactylella cylindrospora]
MSYSTAALPLNTLLDTLLRPLADVDFEECKTRITWKSSSSDVVPHVILGEEPKAGGQWAGDEIWFGDDEDEDTDYYATYPSKVGIEDVLYPGTCVTNIERITDNSGFNFLVSIKLTSKSNISPSPAHVIRCRNVVLATGIFSHRLPPPPVYNPFFESQAKSKLSTQYLEVVADDEKTAGLPLLVVGSGYTAADAILCNQDKRPVIHIYRWQPEERPSPLRGCHPQAYPGYAGVYRHMKEAALKKPVTRQNYEGFPNSAVIETRSDGTVRILVKEDGKEDVIVERKVADIKVCIGRRGRLDYLAPALCKEIGIKNLNCCTIDCPKDPQPAPVIKATPRRHSKSHRPALHPTTSNTAGKVWVQHNSLRERVEENIEVAPNVFIIGSLTGDSLVRFAMGGCVYSAGRIINSSGPIPESSGSSEASSETSMSETEDVPQVEGGYKSKPGRRGSGCSIA